jgi:hypothetical protein
MSFNPHVVAAMRSHAPTCRAVSCPRPSSRRNGRRSRPRPAPICAPSPISGGSAPGFISHDWTDLGSPRVAELKANGTPVLCWTVTTAQIEAEARRVADNITFEGYLPRIPD